MSKRTCLVVAFALSAILFGVTRVQAGAGHAPPMWVDPAGRAAVGHLYATRNTPDYRSSIGCMVQGEPGGMVMACQARPDADKLKLFSCYSNDASLIQAAASIGPYDTISFGWNAAGECTYLSVDHDSIGAPVAR